MLSHAEGRMSDKEITEGNSQESWIYSYLVTIPYRIKYTFIGDVVLADRGFTCNEKARMYLAEVKASPFTKGKKQMEKQDID